MDDIFKHYYVCKKRSGYCAYRQIWKKNIKIIPLFTAKMSGHLI